MSLEQASRCLARAGSLLMRVQTAADDEGPDPESAVTWAFYAYENCVMALAEMNGRRLARNHYSKVQFVRSLFADEQISRDIGDELEELNRLRKDVAYGEPGAELEAKDLEVLASDLEEFIDEVQSRMDTLQ